MSDRRAAQLWVSYVKPRRAPLTVLEELSDACCGARLQSQSAYRAHDIDVNGRFRHEQPFMTATHFPTKRSFAPVMSNMVRQRLQQNISS